jgi:hypothetical protein
LVAGPDLSQTLRDRSWPTSESRLLRTFHRGGASLWVWPRWRRRTHAVSCIGHGATLEPGEICFVPCVGGVRFLHGKPVRASVVVVDRTDQRSVGWMELSCARPGCRLIKVQTAMATLECVLVPERTAWAAQRIRPQWPAQSVRVLAHANRHARALHQRQIRLIDLTPVTCGARSHPSCGYRSVPRRRVVLDGLRVRIIFAKSAWAFTSVSGSGPMLAYQGDSLATDNKWPRWRSIRRAALLLAPGVVTRRPATTAWPTSCERRRPRCLLLSCRTATAASVSRRPWGWRSW